MVVFVTPLYWFSFPTQLKAAIDKLYSFLIGKKTLKIQECALLVCGGDPNESSYEGVVTSYKLIAKFLGWKNSGVIIVPGLHDKNDVLNTNGLQRAETFGKNIL